MPGLMQDFPLTLPLVFRRAARESRLREVVSAPGVRSTWGEVAERSLRLCRVLERLGVERGERVGSFAWNTHRHVELYFAVPCAGRVLHTVNVRLHPDQLVWLIAHAQDRVLFVDASLTPLLEPIRDRLGSVSTFVVMEDGPEPAGAFADDPRYEDLLAAEPPEYAFPALEESDAASICYTSGTTGHPKGVVYSHRSVVLHALAELMVDNHAVSGDETIMPVTPMFHVNGWGLPYSTALASSKLVLTGRNTDPDHLARLIERERVTVTCAVPTVWARFLEVLESRHVRPLVAAPNPRRRRGDGRLRGRALRRARDRDPACLGHDGDVAERDDVAPIVADRTGLDRPGRRAANLRRGGERAAVGRRLGGRARGSRTLDRLAPTTRRTTTPTRLASTTGGCARATSARSRPTATCGSSTGRRIS